MVQSDGRTHIKTCACHLVYSPGRNAPRSSSSCSSRRRVTIRALCRARRWAYRRWPVTDGAMTGSALAGKAMMGRAARMAFGRAVPSVGRAAATRTRRGSVRARRREAAFIAYNTAFSGDVMKDERSRDRCDLGCSVRVVRVAAHLRMQTPMYTCASGCN